MADFGHFSDTDDSAVEELLSEAQELCVLEQVSKINCSGFTDSLLPSDLESRFRKLKSFPVSKSKISFTDSAKSQNSFSIPKSDDSLCGKLDDGSVSDEQGKVSDSKTPLRSSKVESLKSKSEVIGDNKEIPDGKFCSEKGAEKSSAFSALNSSNFSSREEDFAEADNRKDLTKESKNGSVSPLSDSSTSWIEALSLSPSNQKSEKKGVLKSNSVPISSVSGSPNSSADLPSPPRKTGCFWCSPKKVSKKKSKENWNFDWDIKNDDEFLSDLNIFSVKEHQKIQKKAMKEEAKVSREAEKIAKWAKQVSARMSSHNLEDELSDDDLTK